MGISMATVTMLRTLGYDVVHLREQGLHRLEDSAIMAKARTEARLVLTFDLDFGELLALSHEARPSVVVFRMRRKTPHEVNFRLKLVVEECHAVLSEGAIVSVEDLGYRVRRLPIR